MLAQTVFTTEWWRNIAAQVATWSMKVGWRIALIVILFYIAQRFGRRLIARIMRIALRADRVDTLRDMGITKRRNTLTELFNAVVTTVIIVTALLMIFTQLGLEIAPLLASAGVVGVAVGFGAQSLVKDLLTGVFIILENQFAIGDIVRVGDTSGLVEQINLRTTILRGLDGTVSIIPNGEINRVHVLTKGWSRLVLDVGVAYDSDLDHVYDVLTKTLNRYAEENPTIVIEKPELLGVENLADSSIVVRALVKTVPSKQWECGRAVRKKVKEAFDAAGIVIPFPQRTLWVQQTPGAEAAAG